MLGSRASLSLLKEEEICCLCPGIEPLSFGHEAHCLITKLTELSRDRGLDWEQLAFVEQILEKKKDVTSKGTIAVNMVMNIQS